MIQLPKEWRSVVDEIERTGEPIALDLDGQMYGLLLRRDEAQCAATRYAAVAPDPAQAASTSDRTVTYLDLLRADPTLVPAINGRPLRLVTMMNSSYVDPQQLYQFEDGQTGERHMFYANEWKQAIGRSFAPVEFVVDAMREFAKERRNG